MIVGGMAPREILAGIWGSAFDFFLTFSAVWYALFFNILKIGKFVKAVIIKNYNFENNTV